VPRKPAWAAADFALSPPEVDPERLVLLGLGLGGYSAARSILRDKRIKACILDSPVVDMSAYFAG
jgi:dipeptidyl aminopeptidase/acylaminoacyl peptidase